MHKIKLIKRAPTIYLDHLTKSEYAQSFKGMPNDKDLLEMAEEGVEDYLSQLEMRN